MPNYFAFLILFISCLSLILCALALFRAKDIFVILQPIKILGFYIFPLILIAFLLDDFSLKALIKTGAVICLEIVLLSILLRVFLQKAKKQGIAPDGKEINLTKK